jgi:hypothetical protein
MIGLSRRHAERLAEHNGTDVRVEVQIPLLDALAEILADLERTRAGEVDFLGAVGIPGP